MGPFCMPTSIGQQVRAGGRSCSHVSLMAKTFLLVPPVLAPPQVARRGYVVIVQDTRGRFTSEGEWDPYRYESLDGVDTIAWAAQLPYSNGKIGMYGASYYGYTQWLAAIH